MNCKINANPAGQFPYKWAYFDVAIFFCTLLFILRITYSFNTYYRAALSHLHLLRYKYTHPTHTHTTCGCMFILMYAHQKHTHIHNVHIHVHMHTHAYAHTNTHTHTNTCTHSYTHTTYTLTHTHTHTHYSADLPKLQYTHWCIKEAMRLYPPVFQVFRDLGEDMMLQGHLVPKG